MVKVTIRSLKELEYAYSSIKIDYLTPCEFYIDMKNKEWKDLSLVKKTKFINNYKTLLYSVTIEYLELVANNDSLEVCNIFEEVKSITKCKISACPLFKPTNLANEGVMKLFGKLSNYSIKSTFNSVFSTCFGKAFKETMKKIDNNINNQVFVSFGEKYELRQNSYYPLCLTVKDLVYVKNKFFLYALCDSMIGSYGYISIPYNDYYSLKEARIEILERLNIKNLIYFTNINFYLSTFESKILLFLCSKVINIKLTLNSPSRNTIEIYAKIFQQNKNIKIQFQNNFEKEYYLSTCGQYFISKYIKYQSKDEEKYLKKYWDSCLVLKNNYGLHKINN